MKGLSKRGRRWFAIMRIIIDIVENCVGAGVLRIGIIAMNRKTSLRKLIVDVLVGMIFQTRSNVK